MNAPTSIGKRAATTVRRSLLRRSIQASVQALKPDAWHPGSTLFSLAESANAHAGSHESSAATFRIKIVKFEAVADVRCIPAHLTCKAMAGNCAINKSTVSTRPVKLITSAAVSCNSQTWSNLTNQPAINCCLMIQNRTGVQTANISFTRPVIHSSNDLLWAVYAVPESKASLIQSVVPLIRRGELMDASGNISQQNGLNAVREHLAGAAGDGVTGDDIELLGLFRRVPVTGTSRLEVGPGPSNLSIFLRPEAAFMVQSGNRPTFSIAFGRVRGHKTIVRILIPEKDK